MKRIFITIILLILFVNTSAFSAQAPAEAQFSAITKDIPESWWDGGWDKLKELQDFIANNPTSAALCAKAQYYIGCYYYSIHQYEKAIEAYRTVIKSYPKATSECAEAQFQIAQITLNSLNKPKDAIVEYRKGVSDYPTSWVSPVSQLIIGRTYIKLEDKAQAKVELQKVVDNYPLAKKERSEACIELGDICMSEGSYKEAISFYKKAYLACPADNSDLMIQIMDKICEGFKSLDNSVSRTSQFIKYQKYGLAGEDNTAGTGDDLIDPLAGF